DGTGKSLGQRERHIGAEHIERAMREIDDPRHAKDDREARRHQKQRRRAGKTGQELDKVKGHLRVASARLEVHCFILRDVSPRDAPQDEVSHQSKISILMVRSAATPRVSNHEAIESVIKATGIKRPPSSASLFRTQL